MNDFELKLSLLLEITTKKRKLLDTILNMTYNQNCIALSELDSDSRNLFMELAKEKQGSIDEVYNLDIVFQRTFDSIKHLFSDELTSEQRQKFIALQHVIDEVISLDTKICELEANNSTLLEGKKLSVQKINVPKVSKSKLLEQYNKQNNSFIKNKLTH